MEQEVQNLINSENGRVKKLTEELDVCHQKLREIQDFLAERGINIARLEKKIEALSIKPSNVDNYHTKRDL